MRTSARKKRRCERARERSRAIIGSGRRGYVERVVPRVAPRRILREERDTKR